MIVIRVIIRNSFIYATKKTLNFQPIDNFAISLKKWRFYAD